MTEHRPAASSLAFLPLDRLDEAVLDLSARMERLGAAAAEQARRADATETRAAALERELAISEAKLAVEMMHSAGLAAQASHLMALAMEAGLLPPPELTGEADGGGAKGRLAQVYAEAFDARGAELGIEDPARFREA